MNSDSWDQYSRLDSLADQFEEALRRQQAPQIEDLLADASEDWRENLLRELLQIELYYRQQWGEPIDRAVYLARFPDFSAIIDTVFDELPASLAARLPLESELLKLPPFVSLSAGSMLGDYELLELLGHGGMGCVFKARHRETQQIAAVKVINWEKPASAKLLRRFQREVQAGMRLVHPNLVRCLATGEQAGSLYLVMEFIEGQSLQALIRTQGPIPCNEALDILAQTARGLAHLHDHGIIHRDLKPANVMIDGSGAARVLDLGLACFRHATFLTNEDVSLTHTGDVLGTVGYMAPEQAFHIKEVDHRADIYSLGCVLHFLLTGKPPYKELPMARCLLDHRDAPIPRLSEIPGVTAAVDALFQKLLAKSPADRPQSMQEVLAEVVSGER